MIKGQLSNVLSMPFSLKNFSVFSSDDAICSDSTIHVLPPMLLIVIV
jgi:hypothetical protein